MHAAQAEGCALCGSPALPVHVANHLQLQAICCWAPYTAALPGLRPSLSCLLHRLLLRRCPEIAELLTYCGPDLYPGGLPWDGTA